MTAPFRVATLNPRRWLLAGLAGLSMSALACAPPDEAEPAAAPDEAAETATPRAQPPAAAEAQDGATPKAAAEAPPAPAAELRGEPTEVVLWHSYRAGEKDAIEKVVAAFNAREGGVRIRLQAVPFDPFVDKVTITVPRGQGPDLFIFAHNMIGNWVEEGVLEPLSSHIQPEILKGFLPQSVKALVFRKNLYGLPLAMKSLALFYNKALLPEAPASMEALIAAVKPFAKAAEGHVGFAYEAGLLYHHAPWIHAFGGEVFNAAGDPAFDTEGHRRALEFARDLHVKHGVLPKGITGFMVTKLFNEGKVPAVLNGPWFRPEIADSVDYGVAPIPTVGGKTPKPFLGVEAVFISKTSDKKDAAIEAALYLAGQASAAVRLEVGKQPVCHAETLANATDPAIQVFSAQANQAVAMPSAPEMQLVWSTADQAISGSIFAGKDIEEALSKAQAKISEDIVKRGK